MSKSISTELAAFIAAWPNKAQAQDALELADMMHAASGEQGVLWPGNIIGFGKHHYKYESGREGDTVMIGFAIRKNAFSLYGVIFYDYNNTLLDQLGAYKRGKGCLYVKSMSEIDKSILSKMLKTAYREKAL